MRYASRIIRCCVDLARINLKEESKAKRAIGLRRKLIERNRAFSTFSNSASLFTVYMICKLIVSLYLQNRFNTACYRLKKIAASCMENSTSLACFSPDLLNKRSINCSKLNNHVGLEGEWKIMHEEYLSSRNSLKTVGCPFMYNGFVMECGYIFVIVLNICLLFVGFYTDILLGPFPFNSIKMILRVPGQERENLELTRKQVELYATSSNSALELLIENASIKRELGSSSFRNCGKMKDERFETSGVRQYFDDHHSSILQLADMVSAGRLTALNLRPERVQSMAKNFVRVFIIFVAFWQFAEFGLLSVYWFMEQVQDDQKIYFETFQDWLFFVEFSLLLAFDSVLASFLLSLPLILCLEQIAYTDELMDMIMVCIRKLVELRECKLYLRDLLKIQAYSQIIAGGNSKLTRRSFAGEFHEGSKSHQKNHPLACHNNVVGSKVQLPRLESSPMISKLRSDARTTILFTLMHYKIFAEQFKCMRTHFSALAMHAFVVVITTPMTFQLYYNFMGPKMRIFLAVYAIGLNISINGSYLPLCELHHRCMRVVKKLNHLLAHTIANSQSSQDDWAVSLAPVAGDWTSPSYSLGHFEDHITHMLRRELNHPDGLSTHYTIKVCQVKLTYGTIIKVYFWLSVIIVPSLLSNSPEPQISERLMRFA